MYASRWSLTSKPGSDSLKLMNEIQGLSLSLRDYMTSSEVWGRVAGRDVYSRIVEFIETHSGVLIFRVSLKGVTRVDMSFSAETVIEVARRYRGRKGFCFVDLVDPDMRENWEAAAQKAHQPMVVWVGPEHTMLGAQPSQGTSDALAFAFKRGECRVSEYAAERQCVSIPDNRPVQKCEVGCEVGILPSVFLC